MKCILGHMKRATSLLYSGRSDYGRYKIIDMEYDGRPARVLFGEGRSPQSGVALDDEPALLFDYNQRFLEMIESRRPRRLLVIGGGVMMLPTAVYHRFPDVEIDVIEIDALLVQLARQFFDAPDDERLRYIVEDGRVYLERTDVLYDMIILDAFLGFTIPTHLLERSAIDLYRRHLNPGGVVAVNFISEFMSYRPRLAHEIVATLEEVFMHVGVYQADAHMVKRDEQNLVGVASDEEVHFDYLQSEDVRPLMPGVR